MTWEDKMHHVLSAVKRFEQLALYFVKDVDGFQRIEILWDEIAVLANTVWVSYNVYYLDPNKNKEHTMRIPGELIFSENWATDFSKFVRLYVV
jgi:hypothetical protein